LCIWLLLTYIAIRLEGWLSDLEMRVMVAERAQASD